MYSKWYLSTWFICLMFVFSFFVIPFIVGLVLLILQHTESKNLKKKYAKCNELDGLISRKEFTISELENEYHNKIQERNSCMEEITELKKEIHTLDTKVLLKHYDFSEYNGLTSQDCKNQLSLLKIKEQDLIKSEDAYYYPGYDLVRKAQANNNIKRIIRCFNAECDNILTGLTVKNIDSMRTKIERSYETINKIFNWDGISLTNELLSIKLEQLNLLYTYEIKKEQEKAQQKAIKEQMLEEERIRREIEREKAKLEKDQLQCSNEINKLMSYLQKTDSDVEKQLYIDKIKELEEKLIDLEKRKESVLEREANARAGFVYVISNIGSFGENVFKIGMTRRLEPMDRIKELSSASVPFEFDVHAMIFSDDAPSLETTLHNHFAKNSVNKVNPRKEFFNVTIDEIESIVKEKYNNTVEFIKVPAAKEYRQSLEYANAG